MSAAEPEPGAGSAPSVRPPFLQPGERLPWLLRPPRRDQESARGDREADRSAALSARRTALVVLPLVGLVWLSVALLAGADVLRVVTLAALVVCVALGIRAAITTQRFRRRWMDPDAVLAPPAWVTLATVAGAVAEMVAVSNVAADLEADRSAVRAIVISAVALVVVGAGVFAHLTGGRSVGAALRRPSPDHHS